MAKKPLPSPEVLRQLLRYEPETGKLFWRERGAEFFNDSGKITAETRSLQWNSRYAGTEAFKIKKENEYLRGQVFKVDMYAHRVIWALTYNEWPDGDIDHINGNRTDNRINNLRDVSRSENLKNQKRGSRNTSGAIGVSWCRMRGLWRARLFVDGREIEVGVFADFDAAVAARQLANKQYGFHKNHGRG